MALQVRIKSSSIPLRVPSLRPLKGHASGFSTLQQRRQRCYCTVQYDATRCRISLKGYTVLYKAIKARGSSPRMNEHQPTMRTPPTTDMYTAASFPSLASRPLFPNISANPTLLYCTVTPVLYARPPYCTSLLYCNVNPKPLRCDAPAAWATSSSFCIDAQHTSRLGVGASTRVYRSPWALLYCTPATS